jgi:hypothetical protein
MLGINISVGCLEEIVVLCSWATHLPVVMHGVIERGG